MFLIKIFLSIFPPEHFFDKVHKRILVSMAFRTPFSSRTICKIILRWQWKIQNRFAARKISEPTTLQTNKMPVNDFNDSANEIPFL
jgi:hypothetical protein